MRYLVHSVYSEVHSVYSDNDLVLFHLWWEETRLTDKKIVSKYIVKVAVLLKLVVFNLFWKSDYELGFYSNQFWGLPKLSCFHKTLKSISVCKSWNYCTSASSNHDSHLVIIMIEILLGLVNSLGSYKMSQIINICAIRYTFSTLTVTSSLPTFKAHLAQITRACCL